MENFKYCPMCKASLEWNQIDGRDRLLCKECGWIDYKNPLPVVTCLVLNSKGELLLIKRGVEPAKDCWALPGGFIERQETPEEAGRRELKEETGLDGKVGRLVGVHMHESPRYGSVLVVGLEFIVENENISIGDDAVDARFYPKEELPIIPFLSHRKLIDKFYS